MDVPLRKEIKKRSVNRDSFLLPLSMQFPLTQQTKSVDRFSFTVRVYQLDTKSGSVEQFEQHEEKIQNCIVRTLHFWYRNRYRYAYSEVIVPCGLRCS
jgi:hypothetical protein